MDSDLYPELDNSAEWKNKFLEGIMYEMPTGSTAHVYLTTAICGELRSALRGRGFHIAICNLRITIRPEHAYFYPDGAVFCRDDISNPVLIVEVLSKATEAFDRGEKFIRYQKMESLREYVLASPFEPRIEVFTRQKDNSWRRSELADMGAICRFDSLDCAIPIAAIYESIALEHLCSAS